jgi:hypothetical protein
MKKIAFVMLACTQFIACYSQPAAAALEDKNKTLQERYVLMKTKSETYQDYKVIKENIMDAVWKISSDSLIKRERQLAEANGKIKSLQGDVKIARGKLKSKEDSMANIVYASEHINVLGVNFTKGLFLAIVALSCAALIATILLLLARIKAQQAFVKESKVIVASTTGEFEDYKRKSFEKQTKLTRELQTERNRLNDLKESLKEVNQK